MQDDRAINFRTSLLRLTQYVPVYLLVALVTLHISNQPDSPAILWYANAVGIGLLLQLPTRHWPLAVLMLELANLAANLVTGSSFVTALRFGPADMMEIVLVSAMLRTFGHGGQLTPANVLLIIVLAGVLGPAAGASLVTALYLIGPQAAPSPSLWFNWFISSAVGTLSALPVVLLGARLLPVLRQFAFWIMAAASVGTTLFALHGQQHPLIFISATLFLASLWLGVRGSALLVVLVSMTMQWSVATGWYIPTANAMPFGSMAMYSALLLTLLPPFIFSVVLSQLRDREQALASSEASWKFALTAFGQGVWDWDMRSGVIHANAGLMQMLECGEELPAADMLERVHPDDRARFQRALESHWRGAPVFDCEVRVLLPTGDYRWLRQRGRVVARSASSEPLRMIGVCNELNSPT